MTAEIISINKNKHVPSTVVIDFETRSEVDIRKVGADNYAKHPSTEVLCMAYSTDGGPVKLWTPGMDFPGEIIDYTTTFVAHNANFEYLIFKYVMGAPHTLNQFVDTMAMASAVNMPASLEQAAMFIGQQEQKDKRGSYLIQKLCKPKKDGTFEQDPALHKELQDYCVQDVKTTIELYNRLPKLTEAEQEVWVATNTINEFGVPVDVEGCKNAIKVLEEQKVKVVGKCEELTGCTPSQVKKLLEWLQEKGLQIENLTADTVSKELAKDHPEDVMTVLKARQAGSATATAKFQKILDVQVDGRVRNMLTYHGASTGRWASRGGLNLQNIARPTLNQEQIEEAEKRILENGESGTLEELSSLVRSAIKARDGYTFIDFDFSSIENRVSSWISHQDDKLDLFRNGLDEYKVFASQMYRITYEEVTKEQRQIAKSAVLGSMFGQGYKGLVAYAERMGVDLDVNEAERLVQTYRTSYKNVQNMWYNLANCAKEAVQSPGIVTACNDIKFKVVEKALYMTLPSGRKIAWQDPRMEEVMTPWGENRLGITVRSLNTFSRSWTRNNLIGSSIFQSAVQGTARDFLAHCMVELVKQGFIVVNLIHDEILIEIPEDKLSQGYKVIAQVMSTPPSWAENFPLEADGWSAKRYKK